MGTRWSAAAALLAFLAFPVAAASAASVPASGWNGFYLGINAGYGWGSRDFDSVGNDLFSTDFLGSVVATPTAGSFRSKGALGGLQLGYNWQLDRNFLIGLETDFDW